MIVQWFMEKLADLLTSVMSLLPTFTLPTWWDTALGYWADTLETATQLGHWFPLPLIATVATFIIGALAISVGIKVVRIALSFVTLGGGSAA